MGRALKRGKLWGKQTITNVITSVITNVITRVITSAITSYHTTHNISYCLVYCLKEFRVCHAINDISSISDLYFAFGISSIN